MLRAVFTALLLVSALVALLAHQPMTGYSEDEPVEVTRDVQIPLPKPDTAYSVSQSNTDPRPDYRLFEGIDGVFDKLLFDTDSVERTVLEQAAWTRCQAQFSPHSCAQFVALFMRYVDYKEALVSLDQQAIDPASMVAEVRYQLDRLHSIRRAYFSEPERHALFDLSERIDQAALQRMQIARAPHLEKEEKRQLLLEHLQALPQRQRVAFQPSLDMLALKNIRDSQDSEQARLLALKARFGDEAVQRLQQNASHRSRFNAELDKIRPRYHQILSDDALSDTDRSEQLDALLDEHFEGRAKRRAEVRLRLNLGTGS